MIMTAAFHVLGKKINGMIAHTDLISDYITYGSKILGAILVAEMVLFSRLTPMKCNWSALRASKAELKRSLPISSVDHSGIFLYPAYAVPSLLHDRGAAPLPCDGHNV